MLGATKLGKNVDSYKYFFIDIALDLVLVHLFHFHILIGVKMLLFFKLKIFHHCILKIKKDILALGEDLTQGLDYATKTAEGKYYVSISRSERKSFLSLHDNGNSSFLFFNATKKYQFKLKKSEKNHI